MKKKKLPLLLLRVLIGIGLMGFLVLKLDYTSLGPAFQRTSLHGTWIAGGILFTLIGLCAGAYRWKIIVCAQRLNLGLGRAMAIFFIGQFFNAFMLGACGGDMARAWLVARENKSKRTEAATTVFIDRFFGLFILIAFCSIMILVSLRLFLEHAKTRGPGVMMLFFLAGSILSILILFRRNQFEHSRSFMFLENRTRIGPYIRRAYDAFYLFRKDHAIMIRSVFLSLINTIFLTLACYAFGKSLEIQIKLADYFILFPIISVIAAIPITPGSLGVRESLFVTLFGALGVAGPQAMLMSLLVYAGGLFWSLFGGLVFLVYSAGAGVTVNMTWYGPDGNPGGGDDVSLTTTTDVIFALQRNQSAPTLTLMTPLGVEVTPDNLPGNVQFAEVLTYTRNVSPTTTPEMAQTINRVSMCVSPQAAQEAEQTALVRLTHARSDLGTIDVLLDGVNAFAGLNFGAESSAQVIEAGLHTIKLVPANQPGPILYSTEITITGNSVHRLMATGDMTNTATLDLVQGTAPAAGQATIRFAHASPDAPSFDVVLGNDGRILFGNIPPRSTTSGVNLEAGKPYTFEVYAAGTNQLLAQLPNITLTGRGTYSLITLGRMTGIPTLQLAVQADTLPLSQVRLVNALAADQPITMWTQGITIFAQLPFSVTTAYNGFANSSIGLQLTSADISNTLLYSGSFPLQAEADHTLVALDYVTQTQALLLVDDNHLPPWGKTRVRFVHASPNVPAVDVAVQGGATWFSDIAYMNASDYLELNGGGVTLEVRDQATAGVLLTVPDVNLIDGYVYTLFLLGSNGGSPALQLVPRIDVATVPDVQTQYVVHQAQTGTWGMKLNG
ncbi:MAG: flippase-like domain-containing protein, partial [Anaerolineales bacterium]|nr:flippase-like domain-containing protein [Anaerolineales bacterium]